MPGGRLTELDDLRSIRTITRTVRPVTDASAIQSSVTADRIDRPLALMA
jgi:hypothetical protein